MLAFAKGKRKASCELWTHVLGWELRLVASGELLRSQVCRTQEEVFDTFEQWKAAMLEKGMDTMSALPRKAYRTRCAW